MLTLGIDPGTATIGYGLVRELNDGALRAEAHGVITTKPSVPMVDRLGIIFDEITALVKQHQPDRSAVEELFFAKNHRRPGTRGDLVGVKAGGADHRGV